MFKYWPVLKDRTPGEMSSLTRSPVSQQWRVVGTSITRRIIHLSTCTATPQPILRLGRITGMHGHCLTLSVMSWPPFVRETPGEREQGVEADEPQPSFSLLLQMKAIRGCPASSPHLAAFFLFSFFFAEILSHLLSTLHFHSGHCSQEIKRMTWFGEVPRLPFTLNFPGLFHMGEMSVVWFLRRRRGFSKIATCTSLHVSAAHTKPGEIDCNSKQKRENMTR